ncbi:hypothetical protein ABDM08_004884 [Salmonella enterica]|nr:hypothetical protein [Salmonella enterica]
MKMNAKNVATEILRQLGGNKFIAMTGAKQFCYFDDNGEYGLCFRLPARFARHGINVVRIKLTWQDTYEVTFFCVSSNKNKKVFQRTDVYFDELQNIFTEVTGLDTWMPVIKNVTKED